MSQPRVQYTPGGWLAVVTPRLTALLDLRPDDPRAQAIWGAASGSLGDVLDLLVRDGLRQLPAFVIIESSPDGHQLALRAPARLTILGDAGSTTVQPGLPWVESTLPPGVSEIELSTGDNTAGVLLPAGGGILPAQALVVRLDVTGAAAASSSPVGERYAALAPAAPPESAAAPVTALDEDSDAAVAAVPEALPEPGPTPEPASEPAAPDTHADTYYQLLVSDTSDRDALLARLTAGDDDVAETPVALAEDAAPEPDASEPGASAGEPRHETQVWNDLPAEATGGLIDGLPWETGNSGAPTPAVRPAARPTPAPTPAPVATTPPPSRPSVPAPANEVDPVAATTSRAELIRQLSEPVARGTRVLAVRCRQGHLSPPYSVDCRVCHEPLPTMTPVEVPRPVLGQLVLSTGVTVSLDKGVVFGRSPQTDEIDPAQRPNLVRLVESSEISRSHVSITLDGWQVLIRDLGSQNGTVLTLPGGQPEQIRPREDYVLEPGSTVSLADVITFTYVVPA